jgi:hypothetical protein
LLCILFAVQDFPLKKVLRFVHPADIPDLLRIAVNQQDSSAAAAIIEHFRKSPEALLADVQQLWITAADQKQQQQQQQQDPQQQNDHRSVDDRWLKFDKLHGSPIKQGHVMQQRQLTPGLLSELLLLAADRHHHVLIVDFLSLRVPDVIWQLPSSTVDSLLHSALRIKYSQPRNRDALVETLTQLAAAQVLDAGQVGSLLLEAVQQQQLFSVQRLMQLPAAGHLSSSTVKAVGLVVLQWDSGDAYDAVDALTDVFDLLEGQQLVELMQRVMLLSTLGSVDVPPPWCDARMRRHGIPLPARPWRHSIEVLELLCGAAAASQLSRSQVAELLLTAAELGSYPALEKLIDHLPNGTAADMDTAVRLLELAVQHRHGSMLSAVKTYKHKLQMGYLTCFRVALQEAAASLLRTDDRELLAQMIGVLVHWFPQYAEKGLPQLLQLAVRLGRSGAIRALCSKQSQPQLGRSMKGRKYKLPAGTVEQLLQLAVRGSSSGSMVRALLLLPGAGYLPGGGLQLVMEQCRSQGEQGGSMTTSWLWPPQQQQQGSRGAVPGRLLPQQLQQQQQQAGGEQFPVTSVQPLPERQSEQHQQWQQQVAAALKQQPLLATQLLQSMQSGQLPDEHARAMLPPGHKGLVVCAVSGPALAYAMADLEMLLKAALQLQPGQQQQAWVALLSRSRIGWLLHYDQKEGVLLAAVNAAHISSCCKPLLELCDAWQPVHRFTVRSMSAAAVQLACLPALRHLLRMGAQSLLTFDKRVVAELMRWAICSNNSSRDIGRCVQPVSGRCNSTWQPLPPGCTTARAEVLAAVCKLPAAQEVGCYSLVGLLVRAMQQGNVAAVQQLCKLAGAQQLDADCVRGLLPWARVVGSRPGRDAVMGALCGLRGARGLGVADVSTLLQLYDRVDALMGWSAAESQQAGVVPAEARLGFA